MYIRAAWTRKRALDDINRDAFLTRRLLGFLSHAEVCELPHCSEPVAQRAICDNLPSLHVTHEANANNAAGIKSTDVSRILESVTCEINR